jgi:hypothetical protein
MNDQFAPYLDKIMPSILNLALLNPKVKIGEDEHELDDMLKEIRTDDK